MGGSLRSARLTVVKVWVDIRMGGSLWETPTQMLTRSSNSSCLEVVCVRMTLSIYCSIFIEDNTFSVFVLSPHLCSIMSYQILSSCSSYFV